MIVDITRKNHRRIKNPKLASYAAIYLDIYDQFMAQVGATGIEIDDKDYTAEIAAEKEQLRRKGAIVRNNGRSIYINAMSPACVACQKGVGSATFFVSLKCHRDCYYCFNPNQANYDYFTNHKRNLVQEVEQIYASGQQMNYLAVTGGEPLLHKEEVVDFYRHASTRFPDTHKRLYTCGDYVKDDVLQALRDAGLDEIRFSIRMHDLEKGHRWTLDRIALARKYIPSVMVEMPILPGTFEIMGEVLLELERIQIHSINLLEFCYPFINAQAFKERGFKVRKRPFKVLYNYWYAGGVPISKSELECLRLMNFALDHDFKMGLLYCSLENKLTGQNYQQNFAQKIPETAYFSEKDYFLKSAKVFGKDIPKVLGVFRKNGYRGYQRNRDYKYLEFHVSQIEKLKHLDVEIGISTSTLEMREDGQYLRELKVDLTRPKQFDAVKDV